MRRIIVAGIWLATLAGAFVLIAAGQIGFPGLSGSSFTLVFVGLAFDVLVFTTVGAILSLRRPGNRVGIVLMVAAGSIVTTFLGFIFGGVLTSARGADDVLAGIASLLGGLGIDPTLIIAGPLLALVFPDGHLPGPRWRWPARAIAAVLAVGTAMIVVRPGLIGESLAENPFGTTVVPGLQAIAPLGETLGAIALVGSLVLALVSVVVRFRRSRDVEREQLKW